MLNIYTWVNNKVKEIVKNNMSPERNVDCNFKYESSKMHHCNRWIKVQTAFPNMNTIHYKYNKGQWELHIEPDNNPDNNGYNYNRIAKYVKEKTVNISPKLIWNNDGPKYSVRYLMEVNSEEQLSAGLLFLYDTFDKILEECSRLFKSTPLVLEYKYEEGLKTIAQDEEVSLFPMYHLKDLFDLKLKIPSYQRIYCWEDHNIQTLWTNLEDMPKDLDYHLGTIILHRENDDYNIIDGQQRLVTLTIILLALGYDGNMPLLCQRFKSKEACKNISNAKFVIRSLNKNAVKSSLLLKKILKHLTFSLLILNSNNIDLAYTFFSNQNSRGVTLSDFDILKAHHLRFLITNESQSEHLARKWNAISQEKDSDNESLICKSLGLYIFRMRKWMRKHSSDNIDSSRPIKDEYSAAPLIPGIPPFGENFYFYEKIQGGAHFFAFTDWFVDLYKQFVKTPQIMLLRRYLLGESHYKYENVIETVLFAYFSKFGKQYFSEALFCISSVIAQHRYEHRAIQFKINDFVKNTELIMMIDQASSPSFFLAESLALIKISGKDLEGEKIEVRFYYCLCKLFKELNNSETLTNEEDLMIARFTDSYIEIKKNEEYD